MAKHTAEDDLAWLIKRLDKRYWAGNGKGLPNDFPHQHDLTIIKRDAKRFHEIVKRFGWKVPK